MPRLSDSLYCLVVFTTIAAECLAIAWSATSQRSRLVRGLGAWFAIALLIPAQAYGPALFFAMTAVVAWILAGVICLWTAEANEGVKPARWQFQLIDLLVLILVVATIAALLRQFPSAPWTRVAIALPLAGLPLASILIFAHYAVAGRSRVAMAIATLISLTCSAAYLALGDLAQAIQLTWLIQLQTKYFGHLRHEVALSILLVGSLIACFGIAITLAIELWCRPPRSKRLGYAIGLVATVALAMLTASRYVDELLFRQAKDVGLELVWMALHAAPLVCLTALAAIQARLMQVDWQHAGRGLRLARAAAIACAVVAALPTAWLYWQMIRPLPFPPHPASASNHFERIIAIGKELASPHRSTDNPGLSIHPLLAEAARLLENENYVPAEFLEEEARGDYPLRVTGRDMFTIPWQLRDAAERARRWPDYDRGADHCISAIRFGEMFQRGGTLGQAQSLSPRSAVEWLGRHREKVSPAKASQVVAAIDQCLMARDDLETLVERESIYWARRMGWSGRLKYAVDQAVGEPYPVVRSAHEYHAATAALVGLQTAYAIRLFQEDHERLPNDLAELAPTYLPRVPLDPFSHQPLIYRPAGETFGLYSVGSDGTDNGGRFRPQEQHGPAGMDLDVSWRR